MQVNTAMLISDKTTVILFFIEQFNKYKVTNILDTILSVTLSVFALAIKIVPNKATEESLWPGLD